MTFIQDEPVLLALAKVGIMALGNAYIIIIVITTIMIIIIIVIHQHHRTHHAVCIMMSYIDNG